MMVSADGYFEGLDHDISWHNVDDEFNEFSIEQMSLVDTLIFGRRTYELMESYWPTEGARRDDPKVAEFLNTLPKIVFSRSLKKVEETEYWRNVTLMHAVNSEEIKKLKQKPGKDMAIFGSNNLCVSFIEKGLLDEIRIIVNPVVLGSGNALFAGLNKKLNLKLIKTKTFKSGNVLLYFQPKK